MLLPEQATKLVRKDAGNAHFVVYRIAAHTPVLYLHSAMSYRAFGAHDAQQLAFPDAFFDFRCGDVVIRPRQKWKGT